MKIIVIDLGNKVLCDFCNKDWTNKDKSGGFIFGSKAVCPDCEKRILKNINKYDEQRFINGICKKKQSFYKFVLEYRNRSI
jgi:hypothetical protein